MARFHVDPRETVDVYEVDPAEVLGNKEPNVITIRARMDVATAGKVSSELMRLGADQQLEAQLGQHVTALLLHNIVAWRGPDFDGLPCTPANIRALPATDPFIERVANEIGERNAKRESPDPKSSTPAGSATAGEHGSTPGAEATPLATGTSKLPLRSVSHGGLSR